MAGAIYLDAAPNYILNLGHISIKNCMLQGNSASQGGAVFLSSALSFKAEDTVFDANWATIGGGAFSAAPSVALELDFLRCHFNLNIAASRVTTSSGGTRRTIPVSTATGGAIYLADAALMPPTVSTTFEATKFTQNKVTQQTQLRIKMVVAGRREWWCCSLG